MEATANTSFSTMQTMLLSSEAPSTMSLAARSRCAVSSTTAGGLPGPAAMARLPEFIAARTTAGPPVTTSRRTFLCFISACAESIVGSASAHSRFSGPPAETMASLSSWMWCALTRLALGCTLNTTALPPATMPMPLLMIVSVGLVVGVMEPMTP